ncbi:MAG: GldG family protein [Candidatus Xenobia bacterium]
MMDKVTPYLPLAAVVVLLACVYFLMRSKANRLIKYDVNTMMSILLVGGILIGINAIPAWFPDGMALGSRRIPVEGKLDLTANKLYTLSDGTVQMMHELNQDVNAIAFYKKGQQEQQFAENILGQYAKETPHFHYRFVDPVADPVTAQKYQDILMKAVDTGNGAATGLALGTVVLEMGDRHTSCTLGGSSRVGEAEDKISNAILQLEVKTRPVVYFMNDEGEKKLDVPGETGLGGIKQALEQSVYTAKSLSLLTADKIPDDASVIVICGPTQDLQKPEVDALKTWVNKGGRLMVMVDPPYYNMPNLTDLLNTYGVQPGNDVVIDTSGHGWQGNVVYPIVEPNALGYPAGNPVTAGFEMPSYMILTRSMDKLQKVPTGVTVSTIAQTLPMTNRDGLPRSLARTVSSSVPTQALGEIEAYLALLKTAHVEDLPKLLKDTRPGPVSVAVAASVKPTATPSPAASPAPTPPEGRVVAFGNSTFVTGQWYHLYGNEDLFLKSMGWLAQRGQQINHPRVVAAKPLQLTESQLAQIRWISWFLIPGTIALIGIVVHMLYKPN